MFSPLCLSMNLHPLCILSCLLLIYFIGICVHWAANNRKPKGVFFWCHSKSVPRQIRAGVRASARDTILCLLLSTVLRVCCFLMLIAFSLHCGWYIFRPQVRVAGRKKWKTLLAKSVPVHQERTELSEKLHSELWLWPVLSLTQAGKSEVEGGVWVSYPQCLLQFLDVFTIYPTF